MNAAVMPRLFAMMFINFFVWGAWMTTLGKFMENNGMADYIGTAFVFHWSGAIIAPFIGMVADRFLPSQVVLGALHILGGAILMLIPAVSQPDGSAYVLVIAFVFLHMICFMPTINLTTSLAFSHLTSAEKQFPYIRVGGTIGWIAAGMLVSYLGFDIAAIDLAEGQADPTPNIFYLGGLAAIILGIYSFTLPHTPPPAKGKPVSLWDAFGLDALQLLKDRSFAIFALASFLICIPLSVYYGYAGNFLTDQGSFPKPTGTLTIGQMSEILFMVAMPLFFVRLGVKWMLAVGMLAWVLRYAAFAIGISPELTWAVYIGIALHGICYDFFFVTGYIYTDKKAPSAIRAQAQGFLILITLGFGMIVGSFLSTYMFNPVFEQAMTNEAGERVPELVAQRLTLWANNWWILAAMAGVIMAIFVALFKDKTPKPTEAQVESELGDAMAAEERP